MMANKLIFSLFILLSFPFIGLSQDTIPIPQDTILPEIHYDILEELHKPDASNGVVRLTCDPKINNLLQIHVGQNEKSRSFSGYRIQIYSASSYGCSIEKLKQMCEDFSRTFPDIPVYLKYFDPDFKIRVGNFHSRLECIPTFHRIRQMYPSCYPVKTEISLTELNKLPIEAEEMENEEEQTTDDENEESDL